MDEKETATMTNRPPTYDPAADGERAARADVRQARETLERRQGASWRLTIERQLTAIGDALEEYEDEDPTVETDRLERLHHALARAQEVLL